MVLPGLKFAKRLLKKARRSSSRPIQVDPQQVLRPGTQDHAPPPSISPIPDDDTTDITTTAHPKIDHSLFLQLPQELIEKIIDTAFYAAHSWPLKWRVLSSCALVCRSFQPHCQMLMFTHIQLSGKQTQHDDYTEIGPLLGIIDASPSIRNHIRELNLVIHRDRSTRIFEKKELIKLLGLLTEPSSRLEKLVLSGMQTPQTLQSVHIPMNVMDRFIYPYIAPNITSLHLEKISGIPLELLFSCSKLQDLLLKRSEFQEGAIKRPLATARPKIENLEYDGRVMSDLAKVSAGLYLDFSNLRRLSIQIYQPLHIARWQEIINAAKGTLEELKITSTQNQSSELSSLSLNLGNQPKLLTVIQISHFNARRENNLVDICSTLQTLPTSNTSLGTLVLGIFPTGAEVDGVQPQLLKNAVLGKSDWETLALEICRIAGERPFKLKLSMFYVPVVHPESVYQAFERYRAEIHQQFKETLHTVIEERLGGLKANPKIVVKTSIVLIGTTITIERGRADQDDSFDASIFGKLELILRPAADRFGRVLTFAP